MITTTKPWTERLHETTSALLDTVSTFGEAEFNAVPFPGSWTAGQVSEHLLKAESGITVLLEGPSGPADRDPARYVGRLEEIFLDFEKRYLSPPDILPSEGPHHPLLLSTLLGDNRKKIEALVAVADPGAVLRLYPFPGMDFLTVTEWMCFAHCHARRHTRQMRLIRAALQRSH